MPWKKSGNSIAGCWCSSYRRPCRSNLSLLLQARAQPVSPLGDDVHRMHDPRNVAQQGQQDIQPERPAKPDLKEHPQRRQDNGDDNADKVRDFVAGLSDDKSRGYIHGHC